VHLFHSGSNAGMDVSMDADGPVLLVSDDEGSRERMAKALAGAGYPVLCADRATRALDAVAAAPPTLVVVDLASSSALGEEFLAIIVERPELEPSHVVAIGDPRAAMHCGARWFLSTPVDTELLVLLVQDLCGRPASRPVPARHVPARPLTRLAVWAFPRLALSVASSRPR
jgi:DNA-binding NtrC family response regulator